MPDTASTCAACGAPLQPGTRFCNACGAAAPGTPATTARSCPTCGAALGADVKFCGSCGAPVGGAGPQPAAPSAPGYAPAMATAGGPAYPAAPPAKKGSNGCLIIGIILAVVVVILICCVGGYFALQAMGGDVQDIMRELSLRLAAGRYV